VVEDFETLVITLCWTKNLRETDIQALKTIEREILECLAALPQQNIAAVRQVRREFSRRLAQASASQILELALRLTRHSRGIRRFLAYELVQHHKLAFRSLNARSLKELGQGMDNWGAVDTFACYLSGPSWREGQASDALIQRWGRSKDRWWRRAALVSTVALNNKARGGSGDTARTLMICAMLLDDRDDMVIKALSWALRELSKRDPKSVRKFLQEHESALAPRVTREVKCKLQTGLKNPRHN
jgi:3-methyladenine DNA glycosylase AlkD